VQFSIQPRRQHSACDDILIDGEAVVFLDDGQSDSTALLTKVGGSQAALVASTSCVSMATIWRAATPFTPVADNSPLRGATLTGKLWRNGSPESHRRTESPSAPDVGVEADIA
jgi:hypothetical protein